MKKTATVVGDAEQKQVLYMTDEKTKNTFRELTNNNAQYDLLPVHLIFTYAQHDGMIVNSLKFSNI